MTRCLVTAQVAFPGGLAVAEPADEPGGLPKRFERTTRVPPLHGLLVNGIPVSVGPTTAVEIATQFLPQHDLADVNLLIEGDVNEAVAISQPTLEAVIDSLAFQMQMALHVVGISVVDATAPLVVGEQRDTRLDANANSLVEPKFSQPGPNFAWQEFTWPVPDLRAGRFPTDPKTRMALWWYVKSLDAPYAVDKFVALWTATEIMWEASDVKVNEPYLAPCQHRIDACPTCDRSVERLVRGASIKTFLTQRAGVSEDDAAGMWRLRQIVHGKDAFSAKALEALTRLGAVLRAAVLLLLKQAIGDPLDQAPALVAADGPILGTMMALGGHRVLDEADLGAVAILDSIASSGLSSRPS